MKTAFNVLYWGIFLAAIVLVVLTHIPAKSDELSYQVINCDIGNGTYMFTVPMLESWTWEQKEAVAETICNSIKEYQDYEEEDCEDMDE